MGLAKRRKIEGSYQGVVLVEVAGFQKGCHPCRISSSSSCSCREAHRRNLLVGCAVAVVGDVMWRLRKLMKVAVVRGRW